MSTHPEPTVDEILTKVQQIFGERTSDAEVFPKCAAYQYKIAKFELLSTKPSEPPQPQDLTNETTV